jgi:hypothetical protein
MYRSVHSEESRLGDGVGELGKDACLSEVNRSRNHSKWESDADPPARRSSNSCKGCWDWDADSSEETKLSNHWKGSRWDGDTDSSGEGKCWKRSSSESIAMILVEEKGKRQILRLMSVRERQVYVAGHV